jgi:hypothetical protein
VAEGGAAVGCASDISQLLAAARLSRDLKTD